MINLAKDPTYKAELERLRGALDAHLARTGDWSDISEAEMIAGFLLDGEQRVTPAPMIELVDGSLKLTCSEEGASLAYRLNGGPWRLYTGPVALRAPVTEIEARAVRYGWKESDIVAHEP